MTQNSDFYKNKTEALRNALPSIESCCPDLKRKTAKELAGPCPKCGGVDRFTVFIINEGRFLCRGCHEKGGDLIDFHCWLKGCTIGDLFREHGITGDNGGENVRRYLAGRGIGSEVIGRQFSAGKIGAMPDFMEQGPAVVFNYTSLNGQKLYAQFLPISTGKKPFKKGAEVSKDGFFFVGMDKAVQIIIVESAVNALSVASVMPDVAAVAIGASTLTKKIAKLKAYRDKIVLAFDNDPAGSDAAAKCNRILGGGIKSISWPGDAAAGADINDLLKAGQGEKIIHLTSSAMPLPDVADEIEDQDQPKQNHIFQKIISGQNLWKAFETTLMQAWLILHVLSESIKIALLYGMPGSFKSFLALDMVLCMAAGIQWHGLKVCRILYVAAEGQSGILRRVKAWAVHHGLTEIDNFSLLPIPIILRITWIGIGTARTSAGWSIHTRHGES